MMKYRGQQGSGLEVLYPGKVPVEAIRTVDGKPVNLTEKQSRLKNFCSKGRGWHLEPARHSLASNGIKTVYRGERR